MFENLKILYKEYGGIGELLTSSYFWIAFSFSILAFLSDVQFAWAEVAISVMPSLAGFSIAAFALMFAVLSAEDIKILLPRTANGVSPLLSSVSAVVHAVIVQVFALLLAAGTKLIESQKILTKIDNYLRPDVFCEIEPYLEQFFLWFSLLISSVGLLLVFYGLSLVFAAALSVFRMLSILANARSK